MDKMEINMTGKEPIVNREQKKTVNATRVENVIGGYRTDEVANFSCNQFPTLATISFLKGIILIVIVVVLDRSSAFVMLVYLRTVFDPSLSYHL